MENENASVRALIGFQQLSRSELAGPRASPVANSQRWTRRRGAPTSAAKGLWRRSEADETSSDRGCGRKVSPRGRLSIGRCRMKQILLFLVLLRLKIWPCDKYLIEMHTSKIATTFNWLLLSFVASSHHPSSGQRRSPARTPLTSTELSRTFCRTAITGSSLKTTLRFLRTFQVLHMIIDCPHYEFIGYVSDDQRRTRALLFSL